VSRRWRMLGEMPIPSTTFSWTRHAVSGVLYELVVEVDLGDGQPVDMGVKVVGEGALELENEFVASQRFINEQDALNNNWLDEIARKIRERCTPILVTIANLKRAMEEQN
jgi:hypothetical protein